MKTTRPYIYLIVVLQCLFSVNLKAQKKHTILIDWKIATMLPANLNDTVSLGFAGAVSGEIDGTVLVAGGANFPNGMPWLGGKKMYYDDMYVYEKKDGQLIYNHRNIKLPEPIAYAAVANTANSVVYAGGESANGLSKKVYAIQREKDEISIVKLPELPIAISNAALVNIQDQLYLAGGETSTETSAQLLVLDLKNLNLGWKKLTNIPVPVSHTVMVKQAQGLQYKLYLLGGRTKTPSGISEIYNTIYEYDIVKNTWHQKASLPYPLAAGTGIAIDKEQILLIGGDKGLVFNKVEKMIVAINNEIDPQKKATLNTQKIQLQNTHPGFSNEVILYHSVKDKCKKIGEVPFAVPVTTNTFKTGEYIYITSGEIRAGVRAPYILSGKIIQ